MPIDLWNVEWQDANAQRAFPLAADATQIDITGTFQLPTSFILDAYLPVHAGLSVSVGDFHVMTIQSFTAGWTVVIGYTPSGTGTPLTVASAMIARISHKPGNTYALGGIGDFADCIGRITIGHTDDIDNQPQGLFSFDLAAGRLETDAIRPMIRYLSSIQVLNGNDLSNRIYGDVVFQAGTNMDINLIQVADADPILVFNASEGAGLDQTCDCTINTGSPIQTINGIPPDSAGNFNLTSVDCIDFVGITNGLALIDNCSTPCCGSNELDVLLTTLNALQTQMNTLANFVSQLQGSVDLMNTAVLGSRLGDRGCAVTQGL
jgi:hypothetical protein